MFEIPDAKKVRREDLDSASSSDVSSTRSPSRSPSPGLISQLQSKLDSHFGISDDTSPVVSQLQIQDIPPSSPKHAPQPEEGHLFRLFSGAASTAPPRIRLKSPSTEGPDAIVTPRPLSFYLLSPPSPTTAARFASSAVSHSAVEAWARVKWPGAAVPWRVQRLVLSRKTARKLALTPPILDSKPELIELAREEAKIQHKKLRKSKPNKKRRVALRQRQRAEMEEAARIAAETAKAAEEKEEKEARERLKKAAKNRAKRARKVAKKKKGDVSGVAGEQAETGTVV